MMKRILDFLFPSRLILGAYCFYCDRYIPKKDNDVAPGVYACWGRCTEEWTFREMGK